MLERLAALDTRTSRQVRLAAEWARPWSLAADALKVANLATLRLTLRGREQGRQYLSECLRRYRELMGLGLPAKDPVTYVRKQGWGEVRPEDRIQLPLCLGTGGGTRPADRLVLASVTRVLQPKKIFEIGTYLGGTTSVFILNAPPGASILSLDLPANVDAAASGLSGNLRSDVDLVRKRDPGRFLRHLQIESRYEQLLADSLLFDPAPHAGTVELGFIDGAHALAYVMNDTNKMAHMMADRGLVFWHDYGGQGSFRELTAYLEVLARQIPIYRVPETSLAWAPAREVRRLVAR